jgi:PKD repeat protein
MTLVAPPVAAGWPAPVADAGNDQTVSEGDDVILDGSGSFDLTPGGEKLTYRWDFDSDNGTDDVDARGVEVTTTYEDAGVYTVTLTVSDGDLEDTDTCRITVLPGQPDNTPPVAFILSPLPGVYNRSEAIDFEGSGFDADGDNLWGEWDFGDDSPPNYNSQTTHSYSEEGPKYIQWMVKDPHDANDTARLVIYIGESPVPEENQRPDANITVSKTNASVDEVITFDASESTDPDGDDLDYEWDFNINDGIETESTEVTVDHAYEDPGDYTVLLQVRDGNTGGWDYDTIEIHVTEETNDPPVANAGNDAQVEVGVPLTFRGTATDPDGDNITGYMWEFGDGDYWDSPSSGQTNHTYRTPGTYTATFTVEDERGETGSDTRSITVTPPPDKAPTAYAGEDVTAMQGEPVSFDGRGTDDFGIALYEWDFNNDGVWDWSNPDHGSTTHTYEEDGVYTAKLRVTDEPRPGNPGPGKTATDSLTVTINANEPPEARIVVTTIFVQAGELVKFQSDSEDPEGARLDYAWDLDGDGTTDSTASNPTWTYQREGNYRVTLTVTDDYGQSSTDQVTIQVGQTYSVEVDITSPIRDLDPGEEFEFRATITNTGNGNDQYRIALSGKNNGWATLDQPLLSLEAGEKQTVTVTVRVPSTAQAADGIEAVIAVTATSNYGAASDAKDIEVNVVQKFGLDAVIDAGSLEIKAGESREDVATITITNTGNGVDSFRISFSGDIAGIMRTNTPKVDLDPGESRDVTISVDVVEGTPSGTSIGTIQVSSTKSAAKKNLDFEVKIKGDDGDEPVFSVSLDNTLFLVLLVVVIIAVVLGLIMSSSKRKRKPEGKPRKKKPKATDS